MYTLMGKLRSISVRHKLEIGFTSAREGKKKTRLLEKFSIYRFSNNLVRMTHENSEYIYCESLWICKPLYPTRGV